MPTLPRGSEACAGAGNPTLRTTTALGVGDLDGSQREAASGWRVVGPLSSNPTHCPAKTRSPWATPCVVSSATSRLGGVGRSGLARWGPGTTSANRCRSPPSTRAHSHRKAARESCSPGHCPRSIASLTLRASASFAAINRSSSPGIQASSHHDGDGSGPGCTSSRQALGVAHDRPGRRAMICESATSGSRHRRT